ncbi:MAG TPA: hypothetical protein VKB88_42950 [Bryobacteraceae bacterium]|nr:hypothetical protein [Bryobacteraceae bacterium]
MHRLTCIVSAFALLGTGLLSAAGDNDNQDVLEKVVHRTRDYGRNQGGGIVPITYHNGPVILGGTHAYYIWYGGWTTTSSAGYDPMAANILNHLIQNIGGSSYFNINATYYSGLATKSYVANAVTLSGSCTDNYSQGTHLTDQSVANIVASAIANCFRGQIDPSGVYFVLASQDVKENSGFCSQYCGWHTYGTMNGAYVKFAFIGDSAQCINSCSMFGTGGLTAPNGDPGADGMASIIAHELEESTTDPLLNAWYDATGAENADKCAWTFGAVTGNSYNVTLGGMHYLIQQNWVYNPSVSQQGCAMAH